MQRDTTAPAAPDKLSALAFGTSLGRIEAAVLGAADAGRLPDPQRQATEDAFDDAFMALEQATGLNMLPLRPYYAR